MEGLLDDWSGLFKHINPDQYSPPNKGEPLQSVGLFSFELVMCFSNLPHCKNVLISF